MTTLFDLPPAAATADPVTSKLSSAEITGSGQRQAQTEDAANLVKLTPGLTSLELARRWGRDRHSLAKRLSDARRLGWVAQGPARTCAVSGRMAVVWQTVEGE